MMVHELKYDESNQVVTLVFRNHLLFTDVKPMTDVINELLVGKPYRQLMVFIHDVYQVENRETRDELSRYLTEIKISDVAFVGGSAANRMVARVLIKTGVVKLNGDFFKDVEEAINWLKSKRI
jgi:hypothetical protein